MVPFLWRAATTPALRPWAVAGLSGIGALLLAPFFLPLGFALVREAVAWSLAFGAALGAAGGLSSAGEVRQAAQLRGSV